LLTIPVQKSGFVSPGKKLMKERPILVDGRDVGFDADGFV